MILKRAHARPTAPPPPPRPPPPRGRARRTRRGGLRAPHLSPLAVVFYLALGQMPVLLLWGATTESGPITAHYLLVVGGSITLNILAHAAYVAALLRSPLSVSVPLLSLRSVERRV